MSGCAPSLASFGLLGRIWKKYLGLALLPKAGVTIGLALLAESAFPTFGAIMVNAILASVIINELVAPPLTKYAIFKAGEAGS